MTERQGSLSELAFPEYGGVQRVRSEQVQHMVKYGSRPAAVLLTEKALKRIVAELRPYMMPRGKETDKPRLCEMDVLTWEEVEADGTAGFASLVVGYKTGALLDPLALMLRSGILGVNEA